MMVLLLLQNKKYNSGAWINITLLSLSLKLTVCLSASTNYTLETFLMTFFLVVICHLSTSYHFSPKIH